MATYDLVVVGAGLGGLAAAASASKMMKRTLLLEPGNTVGGAVGSYRKEDFLFNPGPTLSYGFERGGAFHSLSEQLGIPQQAAVHSPCYQVVLPDKRITVYAEQSETLEELGREFPGDINQIRKLFQDLNKEAVRCSKSTISSFLSDRRTASRFIRSYGFSLQFLACLEAQSRYFFRRSLSLLSLRSLIPLVGTAPFTVSSGFNGIAGQLLEVFLQNRGEVRYGVPISEIGIRQGVLSWPQGEVRAKAILFNNRKNEQRRLFLLAVQEEVLPVSMLREVIVVPNYEKSDCFFTVTTSAKDDITAAPAAARTITASFEGCNAVSFDERMEYIETLIPFLDQHRILSHEPEITEKPLLLPPRTSLKRIGPSDHAPLFKTSIKGVYVMPDGEGTPEQCVSGAHVFMEQLH